MNVIKVKLGRELTELMQDISAMNDDAPLQRIARLAIRHAKKTGLQAGNHAKPKASGGTVIDVDSALFVECFDIMPDGYTDADLCRIAISIYCDMHIKDKDKFLENIEKEKKRLERISNELLYVAKSGGCGIMDKEV
jgi:hypothetical protein